MNATRATLGLALLSLSVSISTVRAAPSSSAPPTASQDWRRHRWTLTLEGQGGFFGLVNVEQQVEPKQEFTAQSPSVGLSTAVELRVHRLVDVGTEVLLTWMKSEVARRYRLVISPHLRGRLTFGLGRGFSLHLVLAAGLTVWPADDSEEALHPALSPTRVGWSLRVQSGVAYALPARWALVLNLGYHVSSTFAREVAATLDGFQVGLGVRWRP